MPARFISEDTYEGEIEKPQSLNQYVYVQNNPLNLVDPTGRWPKWIDNAVSSTKKATKYVVGGTKKNAKYFWNGTKKNAVFVYKYYVEQDPETQRKVLEFTKEVGKETYQFIIGEDIDILKDPNATPEEKAQALANIILLIVPTGEGQGVVIASKLSRKFGIKLTDDIIKEAEKKVKVKLPNPCNCFVAGTKVLTDEGEKNIEDIEVGDKVLSKNENNSEGELAYKVVIALYRNQRDDIINLHVGEQVIKTTDNHPFWVEGKGWVFADELQVGDKLQKADGSNLTIDKVEFVKLNEPVTVYNFTVADFHTYFVSDLGVWVHNTNCNLPIRLDLDGVNFAKDSIKYKHGYDKHIVKDGQFSSLGFTKKWSQDKAKYDNLISEVLLHATKSLDGTLSGTAAKAFYKKVGGNNVLVWVYKEGPYAGKVATIVEAFPSQLKSMGVTP